METLVIALRSAIPKLVKGVDATQSRVSGLESDKGKCGTASRRTGRDIGRA